ncbi:MAG: glycosyltransferase family 2 protein [Coriobacteriales bacterium]|jgi:hypothetical protein|nr:glycosyltransferase family 2 protein [Coriobacteriales bacterium]
MGARKMVSVAIVAYGNAERLLDLVTSVYPQLDAGDEIVIAVAPRTPGMPSDMTREVAAEVARQIPLVRVLPDEGTLGTVGVVGASSRSDSFGTSDASDASERPTPLGALGTSGTPPSGLPPMSLFEQAVRACKGSFIFLAQPGDVWLPNKVANTLDAFAMSGSILILHDAQLCDPAGRLVAPSLMEMHGSKPGLGKTLTHNAYLGSCLAFLEPFREFFLPIPAEVVRFDQWMGLVAEVFGGVALLTKPLINKTTGLADAFAVNVATDIANITTDAGANRTPSAPPSAPVFGSAPSPRELRDGQRRLLKALKRRERELAPVLRQLERRNSQDGRRDGA